MAGSVSNSLVGALVALALSAAGGGLPSHAQDGSPAATLGVRSAVDETRAVAPPCGARSEDRVERVGRDGEVLLASGRRVRLLDLRLPDDQVARDRAVLALGSTVGGRVLADIVGPVDRWGRHAGRLDLVEGSGPVDIAELLVGEGLALVDAGERDGLCAPGLVAVEAAARRRRSGLWASEGAAVVPAGETERLKGLAGRFAIVEGRVRSVGERARRTYLNFGVFGEEAFTATIPSRARAAFAGRIAATELRGRTVRLRGIVDIRRGPTIELVSPDMLELVPLAPARP